MTLNRGGGFSLAFFASSKVPSRMRVAITSLNLCLEAPPVKPSRSFPSGSSRSEMYSLARRPATSNVSAEQGVDALQRYLTPPRKARKRLPVFVLHAVCRFKFLCCVEVQA